MTHKEFVDLLWILVAPALLLGVCVLFLSYMADDMSAEESDDAELDT